MVISLFIPPHLYCIVVMTIKITRVSVNDQIDDFKYRMSNLKYPRTTYRGL